ncbi:MAG: segregation/condensation protein A [Deltaproteobacteria bacterium]|nr:segregation/condensation protein A [Deltaproteobacteria bacterium]
MEENYRVKLEIFEGPLDLLLFLIKRNELDIYDIPISFITEQYLVYLGMMQVLNVELASEFLVIAATLLEIKARMLIPTLVEKEDEAEDPRLELTNRLLEYQRFKNAAIQLNSRDMLYRDTFTRGIHEDVDADAAPPNIDADVYDLLVAFKSLMDRARGEKIAYMAVERISVAQRINDIMERIGIAKSVAFDTLLPRDYTRMDIVITILAILELLRLRMLRCDQREPFGPIWLYMQE